MRQKLRYVWWAALSVWGLLAFFGVLLPTGQEASLDWLTSFDLWFINNSAYPSMFAIFVGLVLGSVVVPEIRRRIPHQLDEPRPNMLVRDALIYAVTDTKWRYSNPDSELLLFAAKTHLEQRAGLGEVQLWGQREIEGTGKEPEFSLEETPIPQEYWDKFNIDLKAIYEPSEPSEAQTKPKKPNDLTTKDVLRYKRLRVDRMQIEQGDWTRAPLLQRIKKRLAANISASKKPAKSGESDLFAGEHSSKGNGSSAPAES